MPRYKIAWLPGDGVGVDVMDATRIVLDRLKFDAEPRAEAYAEEAIRRAGLTPEKFPVRGGTDGSRLSFMGLPTPNLFNGSMNFHGKKEWVPLEWMEKSVETVVHLMEVWVEKTGAGD